MDYLTIKITSKKVSKNTVDISTKEITWNYMVRGNKVDFSTIEITSKKVCGNNVDFSTIEITSKKYVETMWKFVEIWSSTYRRNIHVESTSIWRGVPVGFPLLPTALCFHCNRLKNCFRGYRVKVLWLVHLTICLFFQISVMSRLDKSTFEEGFIQNNNVE